MGDRRFDAAYRAVVDAPDRAAAIAALDDEEVVHALAAASRKMDAYLADVLAVEVLNRHRRQRAALWGAVIALGVAVALRSAVLFAFGDRVLWLWSLIGFIPAGLAGLVTYRWVLRARRK